MKKNRKNILVRYRLVLIVLAVGLGVGWIIGKTTSSNHQTTKSLNHHINTSTNDDHQTWTCSMHPQIKQDKPGQCPICAMDLIPLSSMEQGAEDAHPNEIVLSEAAAKLAEIQTIKVVKAQPEQVLHLQGKVQHDERRMAEITARFAGRIEKLNVNFTGQTVKKGQVLATIYSPELLTAQRELLEAVSLKNSRPALYESAKSKLKLWNLSDEQIAEIEAKGESKTTIAIYAPIAGTVTKLNIAEGNYVKEGSPIAEVVDLSRVWVMLDAYEQDLPWIKLNDEVELTFAALPGKSITGKVSFVDPFINAKTRVAKVRVELENGNSKLKPEMFASAKLVSKSKEEALMVPKSAVLWTGKRSLVYVKIPDRESPSFLMREVVLGAEAGVNYVIEDGLNEGEVVATNGVFKIDAAAQLQGLHSMMNPEPESVEVKIKVAGNCSMCKSRIEKAANSVDGVLQADWDSETQLLSLKLEEAALNDKVQQAVAAVGHDTEKYRADDKVYEALHECCLYERMSYDTMDMSKNEDHATFKVSGECDMCKDRIETAAKSVKGVNSAEWSAEKQMLHLMFDPSKTSSDDVQKAIAKVGHDTEKYKAPDSVYEKLPECCLYRTQN